MKMRASKQDFSTLSYILYIFTSYHFSYVPRKVISLKMYYWPGVVAHTSSPSTLGDQEEEITGQHDETSSLVKTMKINGVCWHIPAIPAT